MQANKPTSLVITSNHYYLVITSIVCLLVCSHTHTYTHPHIYIHIHTHTHTHTYIHTHIHKYTRTCTHPSKYISTSHKPTNERTHPKTHPTVPRGAGSGGGHQCELDSSKALPVAVSWSECMQLARMTPWPASMTLAKISGVQTVGGASIATSTRGLL